jgi:hypothetical protein
MGVFGQQQAPATIPPGKSPVPMVQEAGTGVENRKFLAPLGFELQTIKPYTHYAIQIPSKPDICL